MSEASTIRLALICAKFGSWHAATQITIRAMRGQRMLRRGQARRAPDHAAGQKQERARQARGTYGNLGRRRSTARRKNPPIR